MNEKPSVLFLCTGNSCRSQMAEGLCRELLGDRVESFSAGTEKHGLNPLAVEAMNEIGIDISSHQSKTVADLDRDFDYVITVCGHADENCPYFPARTRIATGYCASVRGERQCRSGTNSTSRGPNAVRPPRASR